MSEYFKQLDSNVEDCIKRSFNQVPVIHYVTWTVEFPITDDDIGKTFGEEIDVLTAEKQVPGVSTVCSSFVKNSILQVDLLLLGFGVLLFGEPKTFSTIGNSIPIPTTPPTASPVSPDVFSAADVTPGALVAGLAPAVLEWGSPVWQAIWHMANGFRFTFTALQRHQIVQELIADVGACMSFADGYGMSDSEVPIVDYVRRVNERYRAISPPPGGAFPKLFVPVNAIRDPGTTQGNFHPSRAFDLAQVTWGGLRTIGLGGGTCFRKLPKPAILKAGIPIGITLNECDAVHATQMRREMSITESGRQGVTSCIAFDSSFQGLTAPVQELKGATPVLTTQNVATDRCKFKGGIFKVAIILKGYELVPGQCDDLLAQVGSGGVCVPGGEKK